MLLENAPGKVIAFYTQRCKQCRTTSATESTGSNATRTNTCPSLGCLILSGNGLIIYHSQKNYYLNLSVSNYLITVSIPINFMPPNNFQDCAAGNHQTFSENDN